MPLEGDFTRDLKRSAGVRLTRPRINHKQVSHWKGRKIKDTLEVVRTYLDGKKVTADKITKENKANIELKIRPLAEYVSELTELTEYTFSYASNIGGKILIMENKTIIFFGGIMETNKMNRRLLQFFGITLFVQAVTALIGGTIFLGAFDTNEITNITLINISNSIGVAYTSILLQMITAVVIIMLGVAMYRVSEHINKTMAMVALSLYIFEAALLAIGQVFVFGLVQVSVMYSTSLDVNLIALGEILFNCREFAGQIAMIPFGIGAILFYYLLLKAEVLPKWLALWGILTVPFILISTPLIAFGYSMPIYLFIPYVPFEFFTGIYILVKYRKK